jgi:hypothetical protein
LPRRYTEQQFRTALDDPDVRTMADLCRALGIVPRGGNYETLRHYAARLGVDLAGRLGQNGGRLPRPCPPMPSKERLEQLTARNISLAGIIRDLRWPLGTSSYRRLRAELERLDIPIGHLRGQGWASGVSLPDRRRPLSTYLKDGSQVKSSKLRERILEEGLKEHRCEECGLTEWRGRPIPLELDHVDGDRTNNRFENLRLLCPNCHALTPTYRGRNIGRYTVRPPAADPVQLDLLSSKEPG